MTKWKQQTRRPPNGRRKGGAGWAFDLVGKLAYLLSSLPPFSSTLTVSLVITLTLPK